MEEFIVSARKYRPVTFDSVVGQQNVSATLKNAIKQNHLAQAYLFCGPRGVGKTTAARILAKTINCTNLTDNIEACDQCESCQAFNSSRSFNIHELDAASNNSVDDIRNLIEQVRIPPQVGKYSVYIIDEVHMLSAQAFNAFLKTLEEPPAHAIFILATTEKHKIIPTILSRCQIFDFNRIKHEDIVGWLEHVAKSEGVEAEADALHIIAHKADGAMRDALSIFDQIVSFSGKSIKYQDVIENLNVLDFEYYFKLTNGFLEGDVSGSLLMFSEILNAGFDPHNFLSGLSQHIRNLLVSKDKQTMVLLEAGASFKEKYLEQSSRCSADFLFSALDVLNKADQGFKASKNQRLHTELCLISLSRIMGVIKKKTEPQAKPVSKPVTEETQTKPVPAEEAVSKPVIEDTQTKPVPAEEPVSKPVTEETQSKVVPPAEPKPTPKPGIKRSLYKPSTPSIKDALSGGTKKETEKKPEEETAVKTDDKVMGTKEFTADQLKEEWLKFADNADISPRLTRTMRSYLPRLQEGENLLLELENTDQKEEFERYAKPQMLAHLKKSLQNGNIKIEIKVTAKTTGAKKPYTEDDKFRFLVEKNPNLQDLKQQLGLDFD